MVEDLKIVDRNFPVPLVDEEGWNVLCKLHASKNIVPLGNVKGIQVTRGEINQTTFKDFITENKKHARLVKGVEIAPFAINKTLTQGKLEYLNERAYLKLNKSRADTKSRRIATQRITGIDERRRIVATIVEPHHISRTRLILFC